MKLYAGERRSEGSHKVVVWDDVSFGMKFARYARLERRPDLSPSPDPEAAFNWGNAAGPGLVNLAAAILADCLGDRIAEQHATTFAAQVLARLPQDRWKLDESTVRATIIPQSENNDARKTSEPHLVALAGWLADGRRPGPRRPHARVG